MIRLGQTRLTVASCTQSMASSLPAAFGNGAQINAAAEIPLKNVRDLLLRGVSRSDDLEVLALDAGLGRADECESLVVDDELLERDSSPDGG